MSSYRLGAKVYSNKPRQTANITIVTAPPHKIVLLDREIINSINDFIRRESDAIESDYDATKKAIKKGYKEAEKYYNKAGFVVKKLSEVKWAKAIDTTGLKGDWGKLFRSWVLERSPPEIGTWSVDSDGTPLVTIVSQEFISDLKSKPNYAETKEKFKVEHPKLFSIRKGDRTSNMFLFTGPGSASGKYNALEWFMGSYQTTFTVTDVNASGKVKSVTVDVVVSNDSHWRSATRLPAEFQKIGAPKFLIGDTNRAQWGPGGTFRQKFIWKDVLQY